MELKFVPGFENRYSVSSDGYVISNERVKVNGEIKAERILKPSVNRQGYMSVELCLKGKQERAFIHRLVAELFIPNVNDDLYVRHIDGDRKNNHVSNLEWVSPKGSFFEIGTLGEGDHKFSSKGKVSKEGRLWHSMMQRCYSGNEKFSTYEDCEVCDSWLNFQNFCDDLPNLPGYEDWIACTDGTIHLDKDVIDSTARLYSPETCSFITNVENSREAALRRWGIEPDDYTPIAVGQRYESLYGVYEVVEVVSSLEVYCKFLNTGSIWKGKSWFARTGRAIDSSFTYIPLRSHVKVGEVYDTNNSGKVEVIEFFSPDAVRVRFLNSGIERVYSSGRIKSGECGDRSSAIIHEVKEGDEIYNSYNQKAIVLKRNSATNILIKFVDSGAEKVITSQRIRDTKFPDNSDIGKEFIELFRSEKALQKKELTAKEFKPKAAPIKGEKTKRELQIEEFVGKIFKTNKCGDVQVLEYISALKIKVVFLDSGKQGTFQANAIRKGAISDSKL